MIETPLGDQCLKTAFAQWRAANPWASDIPWEGIPLQYRNEIELSATLMMTGGKSAEQNANFIPEPRTDDLAA